MGLKLYHIVSAPFSEYHLTRRFDNRKIPTIIIFLSFLLLLGLIVFNVYTQGRLAQTETILSPHWYPKNQTWNCQPATVDVGNTYFTTKAQASQINEEDENKTETDYRGEFGWKIEKGINTPTSFQYQEGKLDCNVTDISLNFATFWQGFRYRICTRCSTPRVKSASGDNYLSLCASYESLRHAGPIFTERVQAALRTQIYSFYSLFNELHFRPNTLPPVAFPSDYSLKNSTISQPAIPNHDIIRWLAGMDAFNYTPATRYSDYDLSYIHTKPEPRGKLYLSANDTEPIGFSEGVINLLSRDHFALKLVVLGIGIVRPFPANLTLHEASKLPNPLPKYFNLTQSNMALMMDAAANDVHGRVLSVGYLCSVTKTPWKTFFSMLAMIIGNCSGMFGAGLTAMICIARRCERHVGAKRDCQKGLHNLDPYERNIEPTSQETVRI